MDVLQSLEMRMRYAVLIFLRTAERVLICVGRFKAFTYDELFENVKACPWDEFIPEDGRFWVTKASTVNSTLYSPSDIQSIVKKLWWRNLNRHMTRNGLMKAEQITL